MDFIYNDIFLEHETGNHPENSNRLKVFKDLKSKKIENGEKYISLIHPKGYIEHVKEFCKKGKNLDPDTITSKKSYNAAIYAVGATITASKQKDFALVRPPGHHTSAGKAMGFCLFNNIAIATQKLVNQGKKVAIIDFDGHFGNGTYEIFKDSDKVLYCSTHQFPAYPGYGSVCEIGTEKGKGFSINMPLPPGSGDEIFIEAIKKIIKIIKQFKPDNLAISAGFDGHISDPLLELRYSLKSFYDVGKLIKNNFKNYFAVLEGGYNLEFLPKCVYNFVDGINGNKAKYKEQITDSRIIALDEFNNRIDELENNLKPYWRL